MDGNIRTLRGVIVTLSKIGINLEYFSNIVDQIENGKNQFISLLADFDTKFAVLKEQAKVRKEILKP